MYETIPPLTAFGAGILSVLSPCILPLLPAVLATSAGKSKSTWSLNILHFNGGGNFYLWVGFSESYRSTEDYGRDPDPLNGFFITF